MLKALVLGIVAVMAIGIVAEALNDVWAPSSRRGVPSAIVNGIEYMAWPQTEDGFVKTASGEQFTDLDMVFASAPVGEVAKNYVNLLADPNRIAETAEISADENGITVRWWETNPALLESDPLYTIPFRAVSTDGGLTWSEPQNISELPDAPAVITTVGAN